MDYERTEIINIISLILAILIPSIIFFIGSPENINPTTVSIFAGISVLVLIISIYAFLNSKWREMRQNIRKNNEEMRKIRNSLNYEKSYHSMEKRISILEAILKDKRGQQIDPRIIWWILLAILLYLFLKSVGILP